MQVDRLLADTAAPTDRPCETLDATARQPSNRATLDRLAAVDDGTVLVRVADQPPRRLYPALADRGYVYDTVEGAGAVLTAIWAPRPGTSGSTDRGGHPRDAASSGGDDDRTGQAPATASSNSS